MISKYYLFTYIPKWIIDWLGVGDAIKNISVNFDTPVYPEDVIIHKGKVTEIINSGNQTFIKCVFRVEKSTGEKSSDGIITLTM